MSARVVVSTVGIVLGMTGCGGGGGPGNPYKVPYYEMLLWVHRLARQNGVPAGETFHIQNHVGHAKRIWSYGSQPGTATGSGCLISPEAGPRGFPFMWEKWPTRVVNGKDVTGSDILIALGERFYGDSQPSLSPQRESPNTRYNWDALLGDRNNFSASNSDYQHGQLGNTGSGVHVYYTEQIVRKTFGTLSYPLGLAGSGGGAPNIVAMTDETVNPVNAAVTLAHEVGHIMGIAHHAEDSDPRMLMYPHADVSAQGFPELLTGGITVATTVEPGQDTDCGRARATGNSLRLFTRRVP